MPHSPTHPVPIGSPAVPEPHSPTQTTIPHTVHSPQPTAHSPQPTAHSPHPHSSHRSQQLDSTGQPHCCSQVSCDKHVLLSAMAARAMNNKNATMDTYLGHASHMSHRHAPMGRHHALPVNNTGSKSGSCTTAQPSLQRRVLHRAQHAIRLPTQQKSGAWRAPAARGGVPGRSGPVPGAGGAAQGKPHRDTAHPGATPHPTPQVRGAQEPPQRNAR